MRKRLTADNLGKTGPPSVQGADIEIVERRGAEIAPGVILPNLLRINGADVAVPAGTPIRVNDISDSELVTVNLTIFVRNLNVRSELGEVDDGLDGRNGNAP